MGLREKLESIGYFAKMRQSIAQTERDVIEQVKKAGFSPDEQDAEIEAIRGHVESIRLSL